MLVFLAGIIRIILGWGVVTVTITAGAMVWFKIQEDIEESEELKRSRPNPD
jgi:hypothetical protein